MLVEPECPDRGSARWRGVRWFDVDGVASLGEDGGARFVGVFEVCLDNEPAVDMTSNGMRPVSRLR